MSVRAMSDLQPREAHLLRLLSRAPHTAEELAGILHTPRALR
jgi:DNA-binding CsgD family transcriptional regulator